MSPALALLIAAVIRVESDGNDYARGRRGEIGCLQIRETVVEDVNSILAARGSSFHFTGTDCLNRDRSIAIFRVYVEHYATEARIGREPTLEDIARIWNGGPNGYRKKSTLRYWAKVRAELMKGKTK